MKTKFLLLLSVFVLFTTACSDDEEKVITPETLVGTTWSYSVDKNTYTIDFMADSFETMDYLESEDGAKSHASTSGTYSYLMPTVTLVYSTDEGTVIGLVEGDEMTLTLNGEERVYVLLDSVQ